MCGCCKKSVTEVIYYCGICKATYHPSCADQSGIFENGSVRKCCDMKNYIFESISSLEVRLEEKILKNVNETLVKSITQHVEKKISKRIKKEVRVALKENRYFEQEEMMREFKQREMRGKNLMIFGLSDKNDSKRDFKFFQNLFKKCDAPFKNECDETSLIRLGRFKNDVNVKRPIKTNLKTKDNVDWIFTNFAAIKEHLPADVYLAYDKTPNQIQFYKNVKEDMKKREQRDENDLKIKYIKNIPTIKKDVEKEAS